MYLRLAQFVWEGEWYSWPLDFSPSKPASLFCHSARHRKLRQAHVNQERRGGGANFEFRVDGGRRGLGLDFLRSNEGREAVTALVQIGIEFAKLAILFQFYWLIALVFPYAALPYLAWNNIFFKKIRLTQYFWGGEFLTQEIRQWGMGDEIGRKRKGNLLANCRHPTFFLSDSRLPVTYLSRKCRFISLSFFMLIFGKSRVLGISFFFFR